MENQNEKCFKNVDDPFDPESLRLPQNFSGNIGARKTLVNIPVRKPGSQEFIRLHPDPKMRMIAALLEWHEDRNLYLVTPSMAELIGKEAKPRCLVPAMTATEVYFLWPMKVTLPGEKENTWNMSANAAAEKALSQWVNISSDMTAQAYKVRVAEGDIPEPNWPNLALKEILKLAFKDCYIQTIDHPIVKKLKGVL